MTYNKKIVVYIDILGFKQLVDSTTTLNGREVDSKIKFLANIYKVISKTCNSYNIHARKRKLKADLQITRFSDSIVISCNYYDRASVLGVLLITREIAIELIKFNVIVRGAVTIGKIYHTSNTLFGPGLVESYLRESKLAKFPRIIFDDELANMMNKYHYLDVNYWFGFNDHKFIKQDSDNIWYMDYFTIYPSETGGYYSDPKPILRHLDNVRKTILKGFKIARQKNDNNVLEKYFSPLLVL